VGQFVRAQDLIRIADGLVSSGNGKPKQASLRRTVSTTYYALFHTLARCCADTLIGSQSADRSAPAWRQVYRSLEHGHAKSQCRSAMINKFPSEIIQFATIFATMQVKRHEADYDPFAKFTKSSVMVDIKQAKVAIAAFNGTAIKHRRAFAAFVLFRSRS
jgi:uncharacterized protein (UPF0332 family)